LRLWIGERVGVGHDDGWWEESVFDIGGGGHCVFAVDVVVHSKRWWNRDGDPRCERYNEGLVGVVGLKTTP
jgi:hypothetical protein